MRACASPAASERLNLYAKAGYTNARVKATLVTPTFAEVIEGEADGGRVGLGAQFRSANRPISAPNIVTRITRRISRGTRPSRRWACASRTCSPAKAGSSGPTGTGWVPAFAGSEWPRSVADDLAARFLEAGREARLAGGQSAVVGRADDEIGADPAFPEEGVGADLAAGMGALGLARAARPPRSPAIQQPIVRDSSGRPPSSVPGQRLEHHGGDVRHAGEDEDVADGGSRARRTSGSRSARRPRAPAPSAAAPR